MTKHERAAAFVRSWKFQIVASIIWLVFTIVALLSFLDGHEVIHAIMLVLGALLTVGYVAVAVVLWRREGTAERAVAE